MERIRNRSKRTMANLKYVVIGAGGTGGAIGGFLARADKDVTLIARGAHLAQMQEKGLTLETPAGTETVAVKACTMDEYAETPDVIFVCVKGYSLEDTVPFIRRIAGKDTVVIPILNIFGTGKKLQEQLPEITVTDGCIYIAAQIKEPGVILLSGAIFRVVYGLRKGTDEALRTAVMPVLKAVEADLAQAGITPLLSEQIEKDALTKFSFVSPMAAVGACYDVTAGDVQKEGEYRSLYIQLVEEIKALSDAMGASIPEDIVEINLKIMDGLVPGATASMQRDIKAGRESEIDGLIYEVVRLGEAYQVEVPAYRKIAARFQGGKAGC